MSLIEPSDLRRQRGKMTNEKPFGLDQSLNSRPTSLSSITSAMKLYEKTVFQNSFFYILQSCQIQSYFVYKSTNLEYVVNKDFVLWLRRFIRTVLMKYLTVINCQLVSYTEQTVHQNNPNNSCYKTATSNKSTTERSFYVRKQCKTPTRQNKRQEKHN